jgi:hypothetical protein
MSRIDEIRKRLDAATPGPWEIHDSCSWRRIGTPGRDGNIVCPTNHPVDRHPDLLAKLADLSLIANAPSDLAFLLAEVERYKKALDEAIVHGQIRIEGKYVATDYYLHPHEVVPTLSAYLKENALPEVE